MATQAILNNEYATLKYDDTDRYIYHTFNQATTGEALRKVLNTGVETLKEHGAIKWLSDDRKKGESRPDDIVFAIEDWGPRAAAAGWKFWALVVPEDDASRASMQQIVSTYFEMGVRVAIFTKLEEARAWLINR